VLAESIHEFFAERATGRSSRLARGRRHWPRPSEVKGPRKLRGVTFVGRCRRWRATRRRKIDSGRGKVAGSVSKKTSYRRRRSRRGQQADKAEELGNHGSDELLEMLNECGGGAIRMQTTQGKQ
jgi:NAD-dependent DNA ligase